MSNTKQYDNYADLITFTRASTGTYLDSDGLLKTATTNIPRIEYDINGNRKGLLIEEARTNTMARSEEFDSWTQSNVITSSNVTNAPSGELTADKVAKSVTTAIGASVVRAATTPTGSLVASFYAKAAEYDTLSFTLFNSTDFHLARASVSLVDGSLILNQNGTVTTEFVGNGWWRIVGIGTTTQTINTLYIYPNESLAYQGDGTSGIFLWGAQLEAGSFPTSYIPTAGVAASRAADVASIPTSAFGYNQKAGTVVVDAIVGQDTFAGIATLQDGVASINERVSILRTSSTAIETVIATLAGSQAQQFESIASDNSQVKVAITFKTNSVNSSFNGNIEVEDTSAAMPTTISVLMLGRYAGATYLNGHIKSIQYYPRRLSNAQLQELTS